MRYNPAGRYIGRYVANLTTVVVLAAVLFAYCSAGAS